MIQAQIPQSFISSLPQPNWPNPDGEEEEEEEEEEAQPQNVL